jgi:hypothetical protein
MPLLASALLGNKSNISSELFRYIFPHANVSYVNSLLQSDSNLCHDESAKSSRSMDENNEYAQSCLDAVMEAVWKNDDHDEFCGGANSIKTTDGKVVFLTQAESHHHCGPVFAHYSQLEFECIIQLQEKVQLQDKVELINKSSKVCGRKPRPTFNLGTHHPLYTSHVGVIQMKMCTLMLARALPQKFIGYQPTKDEASISKWNKDMIYYSMCLMDLCVPFLEESSALFERSMKEFCSFINA